MGSHDAYCPSVSAADFFGARPNFLGMTDTSSKGRPVSVPANRARRLAGLGGMASAIAGNMAAQGLRRLATGQRPDPRSLLLTPGNAARIADQLARMRGAAMKVGQLISMDAGEMLPPELAAILARLREDADYMPPKQLRQVLNANWGDGWLKHFRKFDVRPIAAASIGQVHRAHTKDGRDLAIKVQYPGVARSIDSDVQNVAALIRLSGLLPKGLDINPLLEEAKSQLKDEADYQRERDQILQFQRLLCDVDGFALPTPHDDLTTQNVLAMSFLPGHPIERLDTAAQSVRDSVATRLMDLMFREIFQFGAIQSDPNFANYRYDPQTDMIALLDFGAARPVPDAVARDYAKLFRDAQAGKDLTDTAISLGFFSETTQPHHQQMVLGMLDMVFDPLRTGGVFDFGNRHLAAELNRAGMAMAEERDFVHVPPIETLFLQRKFGGLYLLCTRLGARVDIGAMVEKYL